ncbi:hypothetical protein ALC57_13073 [Trachymyrmex cornetzi]|uniref:Uncharacterized protein n=1 Tax=Trachymyrmex cornetzi TaxID=471704 RepID=A0A195DQ92_9HYME|nr:hypothetical protein ALC57_13073 [Trachymyrmex cornetzi]
MRDLRRQGLRIIDLTTRLNDFAVTVSPDLFSSSPGITIRGNSKLGTRRPPGPCRPAERSRLGLYNARATSPYVSWGNRSDPVVSRPNHKFTSDRHTTTRSLARRVNPTRERSSKLSSCNQARDLCFSFSYIRRVFTVAIRHSLRVRYVAHPHAAPHPRQRCLTTYGAAGDACKYAHVRTRVYHRRTKRKYRALAINGFTPEHLHVGRPAGRGRGSE